MFTPFTFSNPPFLWNVGQENPSVNKDFVLLVYYYFVNFKTFTQ